MTKSDIIKEVAEGTGLTKVEIGAVLEGVILSISETLKRGDRVDLRGFGSFLIKHRSARDARNPATREIVKLKELVYDKYNNKKYFLIRDLSKKYDTNFDIVHIICDRLNVNETLGGGK